ncbi:MAG: transposase [Pseudomonadota bacterium]
MPRRTRIAIAYFPHHIVQRGHRRADVFFSDLDRADYLNTLVECRSAMGLKVYAYCLMSNHVHLVVDPGADSSGISRLMKRLAGRHARRLNTIHGWSGALWESRFKCSPIDTDRYLLACGRYVDLNPVRAKIVSTPEEYSWSSYRARAGLAECPFLDPDPSLLALAHTEDRRAACYRQIAAMPFDESDLRLIRGQLQRNQLTGDDQFVQTVLRHAGIHVPIRQRGRPRKGR